MKEFTKPASSSLYRWPVWSCTAIAAENGLICGLAATWKEHPIASSDLWWLRCERHHGPSAVPFTGDEPFTVTRLEVRVAVPGLGSDRRAAVDEAVRAVTNSLQDIGGVIVGLKVPGRRSTEPSAQKALGRLALAGPPEGRQDGDRPFWGTLEAPAREPWLRRRKPA